MIVYYCWSCWFVTSHIVWYMQQLIVPWVSLLMSVKWSMSCPTRHTLHPKHVTRNIVLSPPRPFLIDIQHDAMSMKPYPPWYNYSRSHTTAGQTICMNDAALWPYQLQTIHQLYYWSGEAIFVLNYRQMFLFRVWLTMSCVWCVDFHPIFPQIWTILNLKICTRSCK